MIILQTQDKHFQIQESRRHKLFTDLNPVYVFLQEKAKVEVILMYLFLKT